MPDFTYTHSIRDPSLFPFVGRGRILQSLQANVRSTVLIGEARIGKTSTLLQLKRVLVGNGPNGVPRIPVYLNLRDPSFQDSGGVYRTIASYVLRLLPEVHGANAFNWSAPVPDPESFLRFLRELDLQGSPIEIVGLIDNIDQPDAFLSQRLVLYSGLRQALDFSPTGASFKLVASAASPFLTYEPSIVSKLLSRLDQVSLGTISAAESRSLIGKSPAFEAAPEPLLLKDYLFDQSGGHPCLLQELMAQSLRDDPAPDALQSVVERVCEELADRGGSFFHQYASELTFEDVLHLLAIALRATDDDWRPRQSALRRFMAAGLVREQTTGAPEASCKLFFRWFRRNAVRLFPALSQATRTSADEASVASVLQGTLRRSLGREKRVTERLLQQVINAILITAGFEVESEAPFQYRGRGYRSDFVVPALHTAIEVKLIKSERQAGTLIEELEADLNAYQSRYRHLIVVVYALVRSSRVASYVRSSVNPFVRYVVVEH